jgi:hypothetical protein
VNAGAPWPDPDEAESRVLKIQLDALEMAIWNRQRAGSSSPGWYTIATGWAVPVDPLLRAPGRQRDRRLGRLPGVTATTTASPSRPIPATPDLNAASGPARLPNQPRADNPHTHADLPQRVPPAHPTRHTPLTQHPYQAHRPTPSRPVDSGLASVHRWRTRQARASGARQIVW